MTTAVSARRALSFGTAFAVAALLPTAAQATDGYFLNGVGAKAKGAGGVEIAMPQDTLVIAVNPAAATEIGHRLDIGVDLFVPDRGARIAGNGAGLDGSYSGNGANPFVLPEVAYVRPLSDHLAVGLAISGNGGMNTHYDTNPFAGIGASGYAGVNLQQIQISPTVAYEFAPGQSIGVSPVLVLQSFSMNGAQPFSGYSQDPEHFTNNGTDWTTGFGVRVGYLGSIGSHVKIGAFYQSKVNSGRFEKYAGLFADSGDFDVPAAYGAGVSVRPVKALTLGVDYKRIEYSHVGAVGNSISALFAGAPFGSDNGPGFGWRDIDVWKFGAVYDLSEKLTLRAGYGHSENPVPASQTLLNIFAPGVVRGHYTVGVSYKVNSGFELTAYAMRAPRQTVHGEGSIPSSFGGGEADVYLAETAVGLGFGFTL